MQQPPIVLTSRLPSHQRLRDEAKVHLKSYTLRVRPVGLSDVLKAIHAQQCCLDTELNAKTLVRMEEMLGLNVGDLPAYVANDQPTKTYFCLDVFDSSTVPRDESRYTYSMCDRFACEPLRVEYREGN